MSNQQSNNRIQMSNIIRSRCFALMVALAMLATPLVLVAGDQDDRTSNQADVVAVDTQVDKSTISVAERIQLVITATAPLGWGGS